MRMMLPCPRKQRDLQECIEKDQARDAAYRTRRPATASPAALGGKRTHGEVRKELPRPSRAKVLRQLEQESRQRETRAREEREWEAYRAKQKEMQRGLDQANRSRNLPKEEERSRRMARLAPTTSPTRELCGVAATACRDPPATSRTAPVAAGSMQDTRASGPRHPQPAIASRPPAAKARPQTAASPNVMAGPASEHSLPAKRDTWRQEVVQQFKCPLSGQIMKDPVLAEDGIVYERSAITRFLADHEDISPSTHEVIVPLLRSVANLAAINRLLRERYQHL